MAQPGTKTSTATCSDTARPESHRSRTEAMLPAPDRRRISPLAWDDALWSDPAGPPADRRRAPHAGRVARLPAGHAAVEVRGARRRRPGAPGRAAVRAEPPGPGAAHGDRGVVVVRPRLHRELVARADLDRRRHRRRLQRPRPGPGDGRRGPLRA